MTSILHKELKIGFKFQDFHLKSMEHKTKTLLCTRVWAIFGVRVNNFYFTKHIPKEETVDHQFFGKVIIKIKNPFHG